MHCVFHREASARSGPRAHAGTAVETALVLAGTPLADAHGHAPTGQRRQRRPSPGGLRSRVHSRGVGQHGRSRPHTAVPQWEGRVCFQHPRRLAVCPMATSMVAAPLFPVGGEEYTARGRANRPLPPPRLPVHVTAVKPSQMAAWAEPDNATATTCGTTTALQRLARSATHCRSWTVGTWQRDRGGERGVANPIKETRTCGHHHNPR